MKTIFTLTLCLFVSLSHADFISAQNNYNDGKYKQAFDEYQILAKFGNNKAQYNLAVMLVKGQGVKIDLVQAYAWSKVSGSNPEYEKLTNIIVKNLSKENLITAEKLFQQYFNKYSKQNSKVILGPIIESKYNNTINNDEKTQTRAELVFDKTFAPNYPRKMAINHIQGWVDLTFRIYPDGSVRDINVTEEVPVNGFAKEAIKSVEKYRFSFVRNGEKVTVSEPQFATQRIEFKLKGYGSKINEKQQEYLDNLIAKANKGDIDAQYTYTNLFDT